MKKVAFILNSQAGRENATPLHDLSSSRRSEIEEVCKRFSIIPSVVIVKGDQILPAIHSALREAPDCIAVGGGDGTLHAAAQVLVNTTVPMGILPLGTLNHFARDLAIPLELTKSIETLIQGETRAVDVGWVNERYFLNNASLGLYPRIVKRRDQLQERFGRGKRRALIGAALSIFRKYPLSRVQVQVDARTLTRLTPLVFVGNNPYEMDLFRLGSRAGLNGGVLSLYLIRSQSRWSLIKLLCRALFGRLDQTRGFESILAKKVEVLLERSDVRLALDGELFLTHSPLCYEIRPSALLVRAPLNIPRGMEEPRQ